MITLGIQIGHFHPLLVHLPIGIIVLACAIEIYAKIKNKPADEDLLLFILATASITALLSLGTGWLLGEEGGFDEELLFRHRWMAIAFTIASILLFFVKRSKKPLSKKLYPLLFGLVIILISITGHLGGNMTHGEDYLFRETGGKEIVIKDIAEANVHTDIVQPILDSKCVSCHNQKKLKGGLLMTSAKDLLKGGDSGSIFDSINKKPLLISRLHLPLADEEHMPPKGKIQLTSEELSLLEWWVANGHCLDCKTKDLKTTEKLDIILSNLEEDDSPHALIAAEVDPISASWIEEMNTAGITVYTLSADNPLLIASLFGKQKKLKKHLKTLTNYAENIVELNLANSTFNDTLVDFLKPFKNLTKLQLQHTAITDNGIKIFKEFKFLESLNLYGTEVSDAIFEVIKNIPSLKFLYLYQTNVGSEKLDKFQKKFPNINIQHVPKDVFTSNNLAAPSILPEISFFKDSLTIALETTFEETQIYYTLDGSEPDSLAIAYKKPFKIKETTTIKTIATKQGWKPSEVNSKIFTTSKEIVNANLNKLPNENYSANKGKTLIDLKRGTTDFKDGNWLGYEASNFTATLTLKELENISLVSVGAISTPENWIFYPAGISVYASKNGTNYKHIKSIKIPEEDPNSNVSMTFFDVKIPPTKAKFIRVEIKSHLKNPTWHPNSGEKSWIFVDEIVLQ